MTSLFVKAPSGPKWPVFTFTVSDEMCLGPFHPDQGLKPPVALSSEADPDPFPSARHHPLSFCPAQEDMACALEHSAVEAFVFRACTCQMVHACHYPAAFEEGGLSCLKDIWRWL